MWILHLLQDLKVFTTPAVWHHPSWKDGTVCDSGVRVSSRCWLKSFPSSRCHIYKNTHTHRHSCAGCCGSSARVTLQDEKIFSSPSLCSSLRARQAVSLSLLRLLSSFMWFTALVSVLNLLEQQLYVCHSATLEQPCSTFKTPRYALMLDPSRFGINELSMSQLVHMSIVLSSSKVKGLHFGPLSTFGPPSEGSG